MSSVRIQIVFYSMYGHIYQLASAVAEGVSQVAGAEPLLLRVPELVPDEILEKTGAKQAQAAFSQVPIARVEQLAEADGLIFGTPTRFGNMCSQMRSFLDQTGGLWAKGSLIGKPASVFVSTATQHGGQETTITSFHTTLLHHGMLILGVPYSEKGLSGIDEVDGGSPYGAGTITGSDGSRHPSRSELEVAQSQGRRLAEIAKLLKR